MAAHQDKRQKTDGDTYHLIYWPGIPAASTSVSSSKKPAQPTPTPPTSTKESTKSSPKSPTRTQGDSTNPPPLAPPILKHNDLLISQTPNILQYLGHQLNLIPNPTIDPNGIYHVNALALTALDGLSNEAHDTHHPVAVGAYYEDQKDESIRRAKDYRETRLPKFLGYFERVLSGPASKGGDYLYGGVLTYADLVLFQCVDGLQFAFPKAMGRLRESGKYDGVFGLCGRVKERERIKKYLGSERRQGYGMGIYRCYSELDDQ